MLFHLIEIFSYGSEIGPCIAVRNDYIDTNLQRVNAANREEEMDREMAERRFPEGNGWGLRCNVAGYLRQ